jgi:hypothetical protein
MRPPLRALGALRRVALAAWAALAALSAVSGCAGDPGGAGHHSGVKVEDTGGGGPAEQRVVINELMANNEHGLTDADGAHPDWIELYNPGPFDAPLDGWTLSDAPAAAVGAELGAPLDGLTVLAGGHLLLRADARPELGHLPFALSASGEQLTLRAPSGHRQTLRFGPLPEDVALRRITDGCDGEGCLGFAPYGTPGGPNALPPPPRRAFIDTGSAWRFRPCPGALGGRSGTEGWSERWSEGPSPIGAGEDGLRTYIDLGPDKARTPSFCFHADVEGAADLQRLELWLRRDDGARVTLDGVELMRDLLPEGALDPRSYAIGLVSRGEELAYRRYPVDPALLGPGLHRLAVEVHQGSPTSGDLTFDLRLLGE